MSSVSWPVTQQDADDHEDRAGDAVDPRAVAAQHADGGHHRRHAEAGQQERHAQAQRVGDQERGAVGRVARRRDRQDRGQGRADAGRPADGERHARHQRTAQRCRLGADVHAHLAPEQAPADADQHQAHEDDEHAADDLERAPVVDDEAAELRRADAERREDDGEAGDEERRRERHPAGVRAELLVRDAGDVREVRRHERPHARRDERQEAGRERRGQADGREGDGGEHGRPTRGARRRRSARPA